MRAVVACLIAALLLAACGPATQPSATTAPAAKPTEPAKGAAPAPAAPAAQPAGGGSLVFFSSQFKPVEEAEKMRQVILKDAPVKAEFIPEDPGPFNDRLVAEQKGGRLTVSLVGELSHMGTRDKSYYVPWMQATYVLAVNNKALQYLPQGADVNALTYAQLKQWGDSIQKATNQRRLGFPGGPKGLLHRCTQGYLYPSYTKSSGVVEFKSAEAAQ